jgi:hypothetical protein
MRSLTGFIDRPDFIDTINPMAFPRRIFLLFLAIIFIFTNCPLKPPADAKPMTVTRQVRVIFQFGRPVTVGVLDEGDQVRARITSEPGWYEVWWFRGKWKYGYVEIDCLKEKSESEKR